MRILISEVKAPEAYNIMFKHLFTSIAAKYGCDDDLYMDGDRFICNKECRNCRILEIAAEFEHHKARMQMRDIGDYAADIVKYGLHRSETHTPPAPTKVPKQLPYYICR